MKKVLHNFKKVLLPFFTLLICSQSFAQAAPELTAENEENGIFTTECCISEEVFEADLTRSENIQFVQDEHSDFSEDSLNSESPESSDFPGISEDSDSDSEPGYTIDEPQRKPLDLEGVNQKLTQQYINQYLSNTNLRWIAQCLEASVPYRPYIRQKLIENQMPLVLQYLPIVESNYKINAVSSAGARGMWQFMDNSMAPFLTKNTWYDERLDPWKATDAAIAKLKDNYKMFGNWIDAIAAYNCGAGAMSRTLKANPGKDFWYLAENGKLRQQTALYVPKLLAIAEIVENADYYGALEVGVADKLIEGKEPETYDYVTIAGMLGRNQISQISGIDRDVLDFLNPCLTRNCTPAGEKYSLRFPSGTGEAAEAALKANSIPTDAIIYVVKQGDSLWAISRRYGLTVDDLCTVNSIKESSILSIGQKIIIPIFN